VEELRLISLTLKCLNSDKLKEWRFNELSLLIKRFMRFSLGVTVEITNFPTLLYDAANLLQARPHAMAKSDSQGMAIFSKVGLSAS
jgi:hypothetical protein